MKHSIRNVFVLIVVFTIGTTACRKSEAPYAEHLDILFVQSWADEVNPYFENYARSWGQRSGVDVKVEIVPIKDLGLKMTAWLQGTSGDLALLPSNLAMVNTDKLVDVTELAAEIARIVNGFYDIGANMARFGDRWYNVPSMAWPHVWFYRSDIIKQLGMELPRTFDEAAILAKRITKEIPGVYGLGQGLGQDEDISMFLQTLIWSYGGSVVDATGTNVVLNSPGVVSAIRYLVGLYQEGAIPPGALGWDDASNNNMFLGRKIAMTANALSIDYVARRRDPELFRSITHSAYPKGPAGSFAFVQCFGWGIKLNSPNKSRATQFLKDLYLAKEHGTLFEIGEGAIAPLSRALGTNTMWRTGRYADAIQSVESAKHLGWPGPFTKQAAEVFNRRVVNNILARIINDHLSPDDAVAEAANEIRKIYSSNR